jgi:hypothetical protein
MTTIENNAEYEMARKIITALENVVETGEIPVPVGLTKTVLDQYVNEPEFHLSAQSYSVQDG